MTADIAIVGMAGRFPGARDLAEFWRNLRDGVESVSLLSEEELAAAGVSKQDYARPGYVRAGARLEGIDLFDAEFFGYTPREAEIMDPQHRLLLETAWEAMEDAGYDPSQVAGGVGVFAGAGANGYLHNVYSNARVVETVGQTQILLGNELGFLAARVSYKLDLRGPSISLRTACSTSLVAVHLAAHSLTRGECALALAGGCFVNLGQDRGYLYQEGSFVSPDGHCRPFDAQAQGTVFGSGVGIVVLKQLADAQRDGDTIHAVIKGSSVNNDGAVKVGFTAPSVTGQAAVIADALAAAGTPAESIGYVEAHGTGTVLGDPIELQALTRAYRQSTDRAGFCRIGSLKSNTGHMDAAAGVAGLIKTVLALRKEALPPTLHFSRANAAIDFAGSPFRVQTALEPWPRTGTPRRAAVSAFGFGGTNAHLILEEAPASQPPAARRPAQLLTLSARTPQALDAMTDRLAEHLRRHSPDLADAAFTLAAGRHCFAHRRVVVASTLEDAITALQAREPARMVTGATTTERAEVVFLFSGQGAQFPGMAREIYDAEPVFRDAVDSCAGLLRQELGLDLREVIFAPATAEHADRLRQTALAQPALFVVEYALAMLWRSWGVTPAAMLGHSIGEYVAACLAGVFDLNDALHLVALRGRLMQQQPTGSMLGVVAERGELETMLPDGLWLAAHNGPRDCVIAGPDEAVAAFAAEAARRGLVTQPIATSHAFHSGLMAPVVEPFVEAVAAVDRHAPAIPFVSNVSGTWITDEQAQDPGYWGRHILAPVEFAHGVTELSGRGQVLLEVGPGQTLGSLARRVLGSTPDRLIASSLPHQRDRRGALETVYRTLGQLWIAGRTPNWEGFFARERRRRISLPSYPFERRRFWMEPQAVGAAIGATGPLRQNLDDWFYTPSWVQSPPPRAEEASGPWLVFQDRTGLGPALTERLTARGDRVISVYIGQWEHDGDTFHIDPASSADYQRLMDTLRTDGAPLPQRVVHLWSVTGEPARVLGGLQREQILGFESLLRLSQAMNSAGDGSGCRLWIVSNGVHSVTGDEHLMPGKATLLGPVRVIPREHPGWQCTNVDIVWPRASIVEQVLGEVTAAPAGGCVAYRGRYRWTLKHQRMALLEAEPRVGRGGHISAHISAGGVYLVTGGLGGLGLAIARDLTRAGARVLLTGRTALPPADQWADTSTGTGGGRVAQVVRELAELTRLGAEILAAQADVSDPAALRGAVELAERRWGQPVEGVFHAAGVAGGGLIQVKEMDTARAVLKPKVEGTAALHEVFEGRPPKFIVLFGSNAANLGDFGQVDYVAANAFLDAYAHSCDGPTRVVAIDWGPWQEIGMAVTTEVPEGLAAVRQQDILERGMTPTDGLTALHRILDAPTPAQVIVSPVDLDLLFESAFNLGTGSDGLAKLKPAASVHARPELATGYVAPGTDAQRRICAAWQELLGVDRVGVDDNFFDLGGNSLVAIQLISAVNRELDTQLTVARLYECLTVGRLAAAIEGAINGDAGPGPADGARLLEERKERMQQRRLHQQQRRAAKGR